jgi:hypothetical protein
MADHSKWFEITVAVLGVTITGILGWGQLRLANVQQETSAKQAADNIEIQVFQLVEPHLVNLTKPGPQFESSQRIVVVMSEFLSGIHKRENLAKISDRIVEGNPGVPQNVLSRIKEATQSAGTTGRWFAVLASLPGNNPDAAREHANRIFEVWQAKADRDTSIQLYKTSISNNFAVVVGGAVERDKAAELVSRARARHVADDAFVQQDKNWEAHGVAPFK